MTNQDALENTTTYHLYVPSDIKGFTVDHLFPSQKCVFATDSEDAPGMYKFVVRVVGAKITDNRYQTPEADRESTFMFNTPVNAPLTFEAEFHQRHQLQHCFNMSQWTFVVVSIVDKLSKLNILGDDGITKLPASLVTKGLGGEVFHVNNVVDHENKIVYENVILDFWTGLVSRSAPAKIEFCDITPMEMDAIAEHVYVDNMESDSRLRRMTEEQINAAYPFNPETDVDWDAPGYVLITLLSDVTASFKTSPVLLPAHKGNLQYFGIVE